jgi:hypothetical protein
MLIKEKILDLHIASIVGSPKVVKLTSSVTRNVAIDLYRNSDIALSCISRFFDRSRYRSGLPFERKSYVIFDISINTSLSIISLFL